MRYLIYDHDPEEGDLPDGAVEADDAEEAAYGYTADQAWMDEDDHLDLWVVELESGKIRQFYAKRPFVDGAFDPYVEEVEYVPGANSQQLL
jgi:hypothetical protein